MNRPASSGSAVRRLGSKFTGVGIGLFLLGIAGCGVPVQEEATSLPSGALPPVAVIASPSPTTNESTVYYVSFRGLEGVTEAVNDRSAEGVMTALASGPPNEHRPDLRTLMLDPLTGQRVLTIASVGLDGRVVLARTDGFTQLSAIDQVLLVGQVVTSLDEIGVSSVVITDPAGVPIPLVLPDGRVLEGPATAKDYGSLVIE